MVINLIIISLGIQIQLQYTVTAYILQSVSALFQVFDSILNLITKYIAAII